MTTYRECTLPGADDGEWCRCYCLLNGTGKCHYDSKTRKMLVEIEEEEAKE